MAEGRSDPFVPLSTFNTDYDRFFVNALNRALAIFPKERVQTAEDWILEIHTEKRRAAALVKANQDRRVEESIMKIVTETNQAVMADMVAEDRAKAPATASRRAARCRSRPASADRPVTKPRPRGDAAPPAGPGGVPAPIFPSKNA